MRILTERMPHVRSVAVGVWVETGSRHEVESRGGVSHLIEHLVFKGTATRSAEAIARTMDSVGGQMDAFTTKENTCFYVQVLDEHLPLAVDLLTDILLHPLFDAEELEREKSVVLQEIRMVEDTPDDIIHDLFAAQIWGGHPLARPILGTGERRQLARRRHRRPKLRGFVSGERPARIQRARPRIGSVRPLYGARCLNGPGRPPCSRTFSPNSSFLSKRLRRRASSRRISTPVFGASRSATPAPSKIPAPNA
jgi:hypothetical protein